MTLTNYLTAGLAGVGGAHTPTGVQWGHFIDNGWSGTWSNVSPDYGNQHGYAILWQLTSPAALGPGKLRTKIFVTQKDGTTWQIRQYPPGPAALEYYSPWDDAATPALSNFNPYPDLVIDDVGEFTFTNDDPSQDFSTNGYIGFDEIFYTGDHLTSPASVTLTFTIESIEWILDSTGEPVALWPPPPGPTAPDCIEAHQEGAEVAISWHNTQDTYTALRVERSDTRDGTYTDIGVTLSPTDESTIDAATPTDSYWWHVVTTNADGEATSQPTQTSDIVRASWDATAHSMGIPDLDEPFAPFNFGTAGEVLFLVCCRLWRMNIDATLPDPVGANPDDYKTFILTGTYP